MCTVVVELRPGASTRVLAVRDEDPARPWDGPGPWWPEAYPGVIGVRDRRANGAWLAATEDPARLAVILNRAPAEGLGDADPRTVLESRGAVVLDAVRGARVPDQPRTGPFNLVEVAADSVVVTSWDGVAVHRKALSQGVHMVAHHRVDDPDTARIQRWLPEFTAASADLGAAEDWRESWLAVLARSAKLGPDDDRAIIRDNTSHGYPTRSLLVCLAEIGTEVRLASAPLAEPGIWGAPRFVTAPGS